MLEFKTEKDKIGILKGKVRVGEIFFSPNYEMYYFNPSGIAISETQLIQILSEVKRLNELNYDLKNE